MADTVKIPPHSAEAEQSVLGSLLIDKDAVIDVVELLRPEHFYEDKNAITYQAMLDLYENREPIDIVTVTDRLKKSKTQFPDAQAYLIQLSAQVPTSANAANYANIVRSNYTKRMLISAAGRISEMAFNEGGEVREILDAAESNIFSLAQQNIKRGFTAVKDILSESFDRLDELHKNAGSFRGVPTGLKELDDALAGMQNSNLLILAARPGVGKTSLGLNIAQYVAFEQKMPVGFFALEMSQEEMMDRLLVAQADIDAWKLKTGNLNEEEFAKLSDAMGELYETPLYIDDTPGISILEMRTKARRLQAEHGLRLIVVDYLQLARPSRNMDSRVQEVSEISQGLKNLARELKVPVLALSQLSRNVEQRGIKKPQLSDLRESGAIEQDADVVMFMWRENDEDLESMKLDIAKHRNGPLRSIDLRFKGDRIKFYSVEKRRQEK